MEQAQASGYNIALVGASSLKGKEIKEVLQERNFPLKRLTLLDEEDRGGQLAEFGDEPLVIQPVSRENFEDVALAVFASSPAFTQQYWRMAETSGCQVIDLGHCLEAETQARLRAPSVESIWENQDKKISCGDRSSECHLFISAHPAAIAIAGVLGRLSRSYSVVRSAVTIYEPVSERDKAGIDELHQQTRNLLAFQQIPRQVYDSQVAFNLLPSYGELCRPTLREVQDRIQNHLRRLLAGRVVQPALRLLQAPIFHGYTFSCFVELKERTTPEEVEAVLDQKPLTLWKSAEVEPSAVGVAGLGEIVLGPVESDAAWESGFWLWGAADNLRLTAQNAIEIAEGLIASGNGSQVSSSS